MASLYLLMRARLVLWYGLEEKSQSGWKELLYPNDVHNLTNQMMSLLPCGGALIETALARRLQAEDQEKPANVDTNLAEVSANDLTEVDFNIKGKVGSCDNYALRDAFRCVGLPACWLGKEVSLLNNEVQL